MMKVAVLFTVIFFSVVYSEDIDLLTNDEMELVERDNVDMNQEVRCDEAPFGCCMDEKTAAKSLTDYCKRSITEKRTDILSNDEMGLVERENADTNEEELLTKRKVVPIPANGGECLSTHNALRALHKNTDSLVWDSYLASEAQKWANHLASMFKMKHSTEKERPNQGENLAMGRRRPANSKPRSCKDAITAWYSEINNYNWATGKSKNGKAIGHFSQLVWAESTKLGMGIATSIKDGRIYTYIVARYTPPGNWQDEFLANIQALKSGGSSVCDNNPCKNNGTCISQFSSYRCKCSIMYSGKSCETKRDCQDTFGGCKKHKAKVCYEAFYMKKYLPRCLVTCGKCTPDKSQCTDLLSYCGKHKDNICNSTVYRKFLPKCRKTCGLC